MVKNMSAVSILDVQPQRIHVDFRKKKTLLYFILWHLISLNFHLIILGEWIEAVHLSIGFVTQLRQSSEIGGLAWSVPSHFGDEVKGSLCKLIFAFV